MKAARKTIMYALCTETRREQTTKEQREILYLQVEELEKTDWRFCPLENPTQLNAR